jgi:transcriptional regulator with XRE-family HTH domain
MRIVRSPEPDIRSRRLGLELRHIREQLGYTIEAAAALLDRSASSLSRIENGRVVLPARDLPYILDTYKITDPVRREALTDLARSVGKKGWWQQYDDVFSVYPDFISFEHDSSQIRTFQPMFLPGLLQLRQYAHELFSAYLVGAPAQRLKRNTDVRVKRQLILDRTEPPEYHAIVGEAALRQLVGGSAVMGPQLRHLQEAATRPHVTLQVLPFAAGAYGSDGGFTLLTIPRFGWQLINVDNTVGPSNRDDAEAINTYNLVFDSLRSAALPQAESIALIEQVAAGL